MKKLLVAVTTFATILIWAAPVRAATFNFSFTNQFPLGGVNGTVTGRIDGLADTGTSAATAASPDWVCSGGAGRRPPQANRDPSLSQMKEAGTRGGGLFACPCERGRQGPQVGQACVYTGHMFLTALSIALTLI
jgi:hypothetical protein